MKRLSIIGGGGWGTALAIVLQPRFESLRLWVFEPELAGRMRGSRENDLYLPGFQVPGAIEITADLKQALEGADLVLGVMPSRHARRLYSEMLPHLAPSTPILSATKGLETGSLRRVSEVIESVCRPRFQPRIAVLSGPTFAPEIARGDPAAVVISSQDEELAMSLQSKLSGTSLRFYTNTDVVGVELAASLKNVIAIAAGLCHGLGLGSNTMAALITRGLAEMTRLAVALGGRPRTLAGLAGLGDLVLTCTGGLSRNRGVGIELAKGRPIDEIVSSMRMVAEGVETTHAAADLGRSLGVDLPIINQMSALLRGLKSPREAIRELMERTLKPE